MIRRLDEIDAGHEIPELERLRDHIAAATPALQIAELALDRNVG
jgi:hypothetical protein